MNKQLSMVDIVAIEAANNVSQTDEGDVTDFAWEADSVLLPDQPATAAYFNPRGELVIRQRRWPDDDVCIFINREQIGTFLDRLTDVCGVPSIGGP